MESNHHERIADACLALARHIHDRGYKAILVSGGSHELSRSLLAIGWSAQYAGEEMPKTYVFDSTANHILYKSAPGDQELGKKWIGEWIDRHFPGLKGLRGERLCLVDDFARTGMKIEEIKKMLKSLGFEQLEFAVFAASEQVELGSEVFAACKGNELVNRLGELSMHIKGAADYQDYLRQIEGTAAERRAGALDEIRQIGKHARR